MSAVDHGPAGAEHAIARMAATCGVGLNGAMASTVNVIGDVHGRRWRAGGRALWGHRWRTIDASSPEDEAVRRRASRRSLECTARSSQDSAIAFTAVDPRGTPLLELSLTRRLGRGEVSGRFAHIGRAVELKLKCEQGASPSQ